MAKVTLHNVTKKYEGNDNYTINPTSFEIKDKEFLVMVGPSGCGKSTTLRMIAGLEDITSGEISIGSRVVNDLPPKDRDIAMVFQNYALYPHMNVYNNMAFGLTLKKFKKDEIDKRVTNASKILDLDEFLDKLPKQLSGGQRQRVALGRAIVRDPQVFLMDEPLSNLDAKLRVAMRSEIRKLHQRLETTIVYVTHDQTEAMTMGDRIAIFHLGVVQQIGAPQEVYDKPANKFVAGFIGSPAMNFVDGKLTNENGKTYITGLNYKLIVPDNGIDISAYINKEVILGIRPETIQPKHTKNYEVNDDNLSKAVVEIVELMGAEKFVHLNFGGSSVVARYDAAEQIKDGDTIDIAINMKLAHLFDAASENTIY